MVDDLGVSAIKSQSRYFTLLPRTNSHTIDDTYLSIIHHLKSRCHEVFSLVKQSLIRKSIQFVLLIFSNGRGNEMKKERKEERRKEGKDMGN